MSTVQDPFLPSPYTPQVTRRVPLRNTRFAGPLAVLLLALLAMSLVRVVTGAQDITSAGTLAATLTLAMPIALCGLGGLWSERSGVVNIGLEGMMILGTWFGADLAYVSGNAWMGVIGGLLGGLIGGAIHAVATVTFGVDQIVSGVAINILGSRHGPLPVRRVLQRDVRRRPDPVAAGSAPSSRCVGVGPIPRLASWSNITGSSSPTSAGCCEASPPV